MTEIDVPDWVVQLAVDEMTRVPPESEGEWFSRDIEEVMRACITAALGAWVVPAGQAGTMPGTAGFTMAVFKTIDVGVAQPLYILRQEKPE